MSRSGGWWTRRRQRIFERDDFACRRCGSERDLTVDHIRARALGGTDALWNLQTLCERCNTEKAIDEGRLSMERPRPVRVLCSILECPWCTVHPPSRRGPRLNVGVIDPC